MSIFKAAFDSVKAVNTTDLSATSLAVNTFDEAYRVVMAAATERLDQLMAGNTEGWWTVGEVMTYEANDFSIVIHEIEQDITIRAQLAQYPQDVDKTLFLDVFERNLRNWKTICPEGMSLQLVAKFGRHLSASEYFPNKKKNLFTEGE